MSEQILTEQEQGIEAIEREALEMLETLISDETKVEELKLSADFFRELADSIQERLECTDTSLFEYGANTIELIKIAKKLNIPFDLEIIREKLQQDLTEYIEDPYSNSETYLLENSLIIAEIINVPLDTEELKKILSGKIAKIASEKNDLDWKDGKKSLKILIEIANHLKVQIDEVALAEAIYEGIRKIVETDIITINPDEGLRDRIEIIEDLKIPIKVEKLKDPFQKKLEKCIKSKAIPGTGFYIEMAERLGITLDIRSLKVQILTWINEEASKTHLVHGEIRTGGSVLMGEGMLRDFKILLEIMDKWEIPIEMITLDDYQKKLKLICESGRAFELLVLLEKGHVLELPLDLKVISIFQEKAQELATSGSAFFLNNLMERATKLDITVDFEDVDCPLEEHLKDDIIRHGDGDGLKYMIEVADKWNLPLDLNKLKKLVQQSFRAAKDDHCSNKSFPITPLLQLEAEKDLRRLCPLFESDRKIELAEELSNNTETIEKVESIEALSINLEEDVWRSFLSEEVLPEGYDTYEDTIHKHFFAFDLLTLVSSQKRKDVFGDIDTADDSFMGRRAIDRQMEEITQTMERGISILEKYEKKV